MNPTSYPTDVECVIPGSPRFKSLHKTGTQQGGMSELQFTKARRYLELLGLKHGCTQDEIAQAVKRQQSKWHPDRHPLSSAKILAEQKVLLGTDHDRHRPPVLRVRPCSSPHHVHPDTEPTNPR